MSSKYVQQICRTYFRKRKYRILHDCKKYVQYFNIARIEYYLVSNARLIIEDNMSTNDEELHLCRTFMSSKYVQQICPTDINIWTKDAVPHHLWISGPQKMSDIFAGPNIFGPQNRSTNVCGPNMSDIFAGPILWTKYLVSNARLKIFGPQIEICGIFQSIFEKKTLCF